MEFAIPKRLKHRHLIEVVEIFQFKSRLRIMMAQVAETDMKEFMERVEPLEDGAERDAMRMKMQMCPGCLIQAIDYLPEMRIKHRDSKLANIMVMGGKVLVTDFGGSKDLIDEETTASLTGAALAGTPIYWAPEIIPEVDSAPSRRGRAVDIYALGCIFLEMATILMAPPGSRSQFVQYRERSGMRAYRGCQEETLQWIWCLWGHWNSDYFDWRQGKIPTSDGLKHDTTVSNFAFLLTDPNPKARITASPLGNWSLFQILRPGATSLVSTKNPARSVILGQIAMIPISPWIRGSKTRTI